MMQNQAQVTIVSQDVEYMRDQVEKLRQLMFLTPEADSIVSNILAVCERDMKILSRMKGKG